MTQTRAVRFHETGGPEVLKVENIELADPGPGEVRIRHKAIGVNFVDTYFRSGLYPASLPSGVGMEASGIIEAVGEGVDSKRIGDRIVYGSGPAGAYSDAKNVQVAHTIKIPDWISEEQAAAIFLKGMTVQMLIKSVYPLKGGETVLFHAAAGGVGLIFCQWAASLGVTVIGAVGSKEKAVLAEANGCQYTILYNEEDFVERVRDITKGKGVPVVFDSVGKTTLLKSFQCLQPTGMVVNFGQSSGKVAPFDIGVLAAGSYFLTRPTLGPYTDSIESLHMRADDLFDVMKAGDVKIHINQKYQLDNVVQVHIDLESRATTGASLILP